MELRLDGKVAVVTGGSRGIGLATAKRLAEAGARVMITSRKKEALAEAVATIEGEAAYFVANAGRPEEAEACVEETLRRFGSLDVLVNNAATNPYYGPLAEIDLPRAEKIIQLNQTAVLVWSQLAVRASMRENGGAIVNVSSIGGMSVEPGIGWYNVTKAAVLHLTRQLAAELGPRVRVNCVAPGLVRTHLARALWEDGEKAISARLPLRRIGEPDDIAKAILFLTSEAAGWMTGQTVVVDGGAMATPSGGVAK
jgi:NAD(P)-dependent dehydrogenase (short-subunit alcohol dehydrogenase family)